jgi:hypothetical protein
MGHDSSAADILIADDPRLAKPGILQTIDVLRAGYLVVDRGQHPPGAQAHRSLADHTALPRPIPEKRPARFLSHVMENFACQHNRCLCLPRHLSPREPRERRS